MNERLKQARKKLNLNQADFGKKIGLTASAVSRLESGDIGFTEQTIKSICREFNINYDWLKCGEGEMFEAVPESLVDELTQEFELDDLDRRIILGYLRLSESDRAAVKRYVQNIVDQLEDK